MRPLLLPLLVCAAAAGPVLSAPRGPAVSTRVLRLLPRRLTGSGGQLSLKVRVSVRGKQVNEVRAQGVVPDSGGGQIVSLQGGGGGVYSGTLLMPANFKSTSVRGSVVLYIYTGSAPLQRTVATVPLGPGGDNLPPPPPPN